MAGRNGFENGEEAAEGRQKGALRRSACCPAAAKALAAQWASAEDIFNIGIGIDSRWRNAKEWNNGIQEYVVRLKFGIKVFQLPCQVSSFKM